ncbi:MAG: hypothetical protein ACI9PY_003681 [Ascidiaceihabitans sp.]|jgi:hypothetical protein
MIKVLAFLLANLCGVNANVVDRKFKISGTSASLKHPHPGFYRYNPKQRGKLTDRTHHALVMMLPK